jgi:hypothetical protein
MNLVSLAIPQFPAVSGAGDEWRPTALHGPWHRDPVARQPIFRPHCSKYVDIVDFNPA